MEDGVGESLLRTLVTQTGHLDLTSAASLLLTFPFRLSLVHTSNHLPHVFKFRLMLDGNLPWVVVETVENTINSTN